MALKIVEAQEIFDAVKANDLMKVKTLVEKDTNIIELKDIGGNTPLHQAVISSATQIVEYLISKKANINAVDNRGYTPLHYSCQYNFENIAKILVENGAGINIKENRGLTPIFLTARNGNLSLVKMMIERGADPNRKIEGVWITPIGWAAENGHANVVNYLLDQKVDIDTGSIQLKRFSVTKGLGRLFNTLKKKGADFDLRNGNGGGLLHLAAEGGDVEILASFLKNHDDLDTKDRYGWTPLHYAGYNERTEAVSFLLEKGSNTDIRDLSGKTAYNIAEQRHNAELIKLMKEAKSNKKPQQFPILKGKYLGQKEPGEIPEIFAPGIVSTNEIEHGNITFSPDGNEIFWTSSFRASKSSGHAGSFKIYTSRNEKGKGKWTIPEQVFFTKNEITTDDVPYYSPDGSKLIFMSRRATLPGGKDEAAENYWFISKIKDTWGNPALLDDFLNTIQIRWQISASNNGSLFFSSSMPDGFGALDIFIAKNVNGNYERPANLGSTINSKADETGPYIAPDESYIIFCKELRGDRNYKNGLYISFKNHQGSWTTPVYLGDKINMGGASSPYVSPDGKYLFFMSGRHGNYDIFWVSTKIIEELRPKE